jgi:FkbM family methyltransferase
VEFLNQKFVTHSARERHRVIDRFKTEVGLQEFIKYFGDLNGQQSIFWDIGACVGNFSIYASEYFKEVHCFEPDLLTYSSLLQNVHYSKKTNLQTYPIALGKFTGLSKINMPVFSIANAYNVVGRSIDQWGNEFVPQSSINIQVYDAATLIQDWDLQIPNYIKIDVDGNELEILQGFGEHLGSPALVGIFIELISANPECQNSIDLLDKFGFKENLDFNNEGTSNRIFLK